MFQRFSQPLKSGGEFYARGDGFEGGRGGVCSRSGAGGSGRGRQEVRLEKGDRRGETVGRGSFRADRAWKSGIAAAFFRGWGSFGEAGGEEVPEGVGGEGGGEDDGGSANWVGDFKAPGVEVDAAGGVGAPGAVFDVAFDGAADG